MPRRKSLNVSLVLSSFRLLKLWRLLFVCFVIVIDFGVNLFRFVLFFFPFSFLFYCFICLFSSCCFFN